MVCEMDFTITNVPATPSSTSRSSPSGVQVIVTSDPTNGTLRSCPSTMLSTSSTSKIPDPRQRVFARRTSHTLLFVPEQRRVSTVSGVSITSCPTDFNEDFDATESSRVTPPSKNFIRHQMFPTSTGTLGTLGTEASTMPMTSLSASPPDIMRRKSVQTGAPAIGFRPKKCFERRASQPTISVNLMGMNSPSGRRILELQQQQLNQNQSMPPIHPGPRMSIGIHQGNLTKRVSWMSMKSLQDSMVEPLMELRRQQQEKENNIINGVKTTDSRTNSQLGSVLQLDDGVYDLETDTPPMDTMSWSNTYWFGVLRGKTEIIKH